MKLPSTFIHNHSKESGFTLTEILIVIGIMSVIISLGLFLSMDFYRTFSFNADRDVLASVIQRARSRAISNINESAHGVYIDNTGREFILFQGNSYATRNPVLDQNIDASPRMTYGGLSEVVFLSLSGESATTGDITISNGAKNAIVSINNEGRINY